jgi:hypothetical protein
VDLYVNIDVLEKHTVFIASSFLDYDWPIPPSLDLPLTLHTLSNNPTSALKMETLFFSETPASTYESTRRHNPEEHGHLLRRENLKSRIILVKFMQIIRELQTFCKKSVDTNISRL